MRVDMRQLPVSRRIAGMSPDESAPADAGPSLTVSAVARRLGVAPATLRTWDRRYGVGPSDHAAGSHRRYSPADVHRLEVMRRLTLDGVTPAEAARVARIEVDGDAAAPPVHQRRGSGGRVVALPGADPAVRGLARAAMALDAPAATRIVGEHLQRSGATWTWDNLLVPVLVGVGERWESTGTGVDVEHVLSEAVLSALHSSAPLRPEPVNARPVLLAGTPAEQHTIPIHMLGYALAERRVGCRILGGRVPSGALADALRRSGASAVFLWAHRPDVIPPDVFAQLPRTRPSAMVVVGGPGWLEPLPADVVLVRSLPEAVEVLTRSALG